MPERAPMVGPKALSKLIARLKRSVASEPRRCAASHAASWTRLWMRERSVS